MSGRTNIATLLCVFLSVQCSEGTGVQCISNSGSPVDWFIAYKLPGNVQSLPSNSFFYMDPDQLSWKLSSTTMDKHGHAVYYTLNQIYQHSACENQTCGDSDLLYLMYNDQDKFNIHPGWKSDSHGHTKGVVAFDKTTGFWLVHSLPEFAAPKASGYKWPDSGERNGQTFLCISMKTDSYLDVIGKQLLYNYPYVYDKLTSDYFDQKFPNIVAVMNGKHVTDSPWNSEAELTSLSGTTFISFAKFSNFEKDLYADWLAPRFQDTLLVETWQSGSGGRLCSNCTIKYKVYNIESVSFPESDATFKETTDHSKWTITKDQQWTCIGDINRMRSQEHRAGGTVCLKNGSVWKNFNSIVNSTHDCGPCT